MQRHKNTWMPSQLNVSKFINKVYNLPHKKCIWVVKTKENYKIILSIVCLNQLANHLHFTFLNSNLHCSRVNKNNEIIIFLTDHTCFKTHLFLFFNQRTVFCFEFHMAYWNWIRHQNIEFNFGFDKTMYLCILKTIYQFTKVLLLVEHQASAIKRFYIKLIQLIHGRDMTLWSSENKRHS